MVSFTAAASALALLASSSLSSAETVRANRRLSFELIAGYEPLSQVTDHVSRISPYILVMSIICSCYPKHLWTTAILVL